MLPLPPRSTLFPYTTLFRSYLLIPQGTRITGSTTVSSHTGNPGPWWCGSGSSSRTASRSRSKTCPPPIRSEEHTSELQSQSNLVCRLLLEKKKKRIKHIKHE